MAFKPHQLWSLAFPAHADPRGKPQSCSLSTHSGSSPAQRACCPRAPAAPAASQEVSCRSGVGGGMEEEGRRYPAQPALMEMVLQGQGVPPRLRSEITPGASPETPNRLRERRWYGLGPSHWHKRENHQLSNHSAGRPADEDPTTLALLLYVLLLLILSWLRNHFQDCPLRKNHTIHTWGCTKPPTLAQTHTHMRPWNTPPVVRAESL